MKKKKKQNFVTEWHAFVWIYLLFKFQAIYFQAISFYQ